MGGTSRARDIEGAWELVAYELNGRAVPVSGLAVFGNGRFGMIYSMEPGQRFGRAHTGLYEEHAGRVEFDVRLWVQKTDTLTGLVPGKRVGAEVEWDDGALILHFDGGSVQWLRQIEGAAGPLAAGSWEPDSTDHGNPGESARAALVANAGHYVLMQVVEGTRKGTAYGGAVEAEARLRADWTISVDGAEGTVALGEDSPELGFSRTGDSVEIRDERGKLLSFTRR